MAPDTGLKVGGGHKLFQVKIMPQNYIKMVERNYLRKKWGAKAPPGPPLSGALNIANVGRSYIIYRGNLSESNSLFSF